MIGIKILSNQDWISKDGGHFVRVLGVGKKEVHIGHLNLNKDSMIISRTDFRTIYDPWNFLETLEDDKRRKQNRVY